MRYELAFYIPEGGILHSHHRENPKYYIVLTGWALYQRCNVFSVRYKPGLYIPEGGILHSHLRENLISHTTESPSGSLHDISLIIELCSNAT
jgi:hypothetical protein